MASDRLTGGAHGWLKSAAGRATGSELRTRKSLIRLDFIEQKSERSVMPQDTGVGRNVVLDGLDFASLRRVWEQAFGAAPPRSLSRVFMRRVLAYERQCRTHGGLSAATRRALAAMANETPSSGAPAGSVSAGTHLVREWNGRTYQVEVSTTAIGSMAKPIRPHYHRKANHRNPLVKTTLFRSDAQAQGLT